MRHLLLATFAGVLIAGCSNNNPISPDQSAALNSSQVQQGSTGNSDDAAERKRRGGSTFEGTITAVHAADGVVVIGNSKIQTNGSTKIERNDEDAKLEDFRVGDYGQAVWYAGEPAAAKVEAKGLK